LNVINHDGMNTQDLPNDAHIIFMVSIFKSTI